MKETIKEKLDRYVEEGKIDELIEKSISDNKNSHEFIVQKDLASALYEYAKLFGEKIEIVRLNVSTYYILGSYKFKELDYFVIKGRLYSNQTFSITKDPYYSRKNRLKELL